MVGKLAIKQVPAVLSGHDELSVCLNTATSRLVYLHGVTGVTIDRHCFTPPPHPFHLSLLAHPDSKSAYFYTDEPFSAETFRFYANFSEYGRMKKKKK